MKKRTKKHDLTARYRRAAQSSINGLQIVFVVDGDPSCDVIKKNGDRVKVNQSLIDAIDGVPYIWSILIAVFCRTQSGENYMQTRQIDTKSRYYKKAITEFLNDEHTKLLREANSNHVVTCGWLGSPVPFEFNDKDAAEVFKKFNAWNFLSKYESDNK